MFWICKPDDWFFSNVPMRLRMKDHRNYITLIGILTTWWSNIEFCILVYFLHHSYKKYGSKYDKWKHFKCYFLSCSVDFASQIRFPSKQIFQRMTHLGTPDLFGCQWWLCWDTNNAIYMTTYNLCIYMLCLLQYGNIYYTHVLKYTWHLRLTGHVYPGNDLF